MIHQTLTWNPDISAAPKGEMVTTPYTIMVKGEPVERTRTEHVPTRIMALTKCGKVMSTYWLPAKHTRSGAVLDGDRWSGFNRGEQPLLWCAWPDAAELAASHAAISAAHVLAHAEVDA